jgi:lipopolysaccharide heptosyltransferase II
MHCGTWGDARRVLCVRLDAMGDVVMTEPALRALKQAAPGRQVALLTSPSGAEAASLLAGVDDVLVYNAPWMKSTEPRYNSSLDRQFARRLRNMRFDAAAIFTVYSQSPLPAAMLCYLADIPLRLAHCRENPYQLLTHWVCETEPQSGIRHEVQRQLDLALLAGGQVFDSRIRLRISRADVAFSRSQLRSVGVDSSAPWIVIHPGATAASRRWPPELFAEAGDELAGSGGLQIVFTGGPNERTLIESIRARMSQQSFSLAGRLNTSQLAALLSEASMLLSNNTGPVHLAAGVDTPIVDVYALTNPQHTPWRTPSRVLSFDVPCKNCYRSVCPEEHHACLRNVTPEQVVSAALSLLEETRRSVPVERVAS